MKCPQCGAETRHQGTRATLVGYGSPPGHDHDDNCEKRDYHCSRCGHDWSESRRRRCPRADCEWLGIEECPCHLGKKVDEWTDPEDYVTEDLQRFLTSRG